MMRWFMLIAVLGSFALLTDMPPGRSQEKKEVPETKPLLTLSGEKSKITKEKLLRITTDEEWRALWWEHWTGSPDPERLPADFQRVNLDFEKVMAIAVFQGEWKGSTTANKCTITEKGGKIQVKMDIRGRQTGTGEDYPVIQPVIQQWQILVIPRSIKEVVLEESYRNLISDPPKWKEWKRFPAIDEKK